ncbi:MAG TPA: autoinducer 2 ABC transporter substrate-binding protein [Candidatus Blautia faecipullorum]|nr:autoinducer 2 ABC transporter substrate-binding protein [Candidatus Blautia faecipullorum]
MKLRKRVLAMATAGVLGVCAMPAGVLAAEDEYKIVVMPKQVGITYFEAARAGVEKAGEALGVDAVFTGPTVADAAEQVKMIQDLISQGVDAIAVSANDAASLTPVLQQARDQGIVIMDWDSPAEEDVVDLSIKEIDYQTYAEATWDALVEAMGTDEGEYAILTSTLTAGSCNAWIEFGEAYAEEKYPNLTLVTDPVCTNENVQEAYTKTLDLLTTYPDLKGIIGFSSPAPIGAGQAISERGLQDSVALVGSAMPNDAREYLHEGAIDTVLLWEPERLGYLTVYLAKYILDGNEVADGELEVPDFGTIDINGKEVIMGPPSVFTDENVDDFDF